MTIDRILPASVFLLGAVVSLPSTAESRFTPLLESKIAFLDAEQAGEEESGAAAVVAPGFEYELSFPTASMSLAYQIQVIEYSDLDRDDRNLSRASLDSEFIHSRGRWQSQLFGLIRQADADVDGILSNRDEIFNDQTEELRIVGANTFFTDRLSPDVEYRAIFGIDSAKFESGDDTRGADIELTIDNLLSTQRFTWSGELQTQATETRTDFDERDSRIDSVGVEFNYRIDERWQVFTDLTASETDDDDLTADQEGYIVGFLWAPKSYTFLRVGVGELDDSESYSLDAESRGRNIRLTVGYREEITTARDETLARLNQDSLIGSVNSQSLSSEPVVQQRADIGLIVEGVRSEFEVELFDYSRDQVNVNDSEKGSGIEMTFTRRLPRESRLALGAFGQRTELNETNDLVELSLNFNSRRSQYLEIGAALITTKQTSTLAENEYEQVQLILSALARF